MPCDMMHGASDYYREKEISELRDEIKKLKEKDMPCDESRSPNQYEIKELLKDFIHNSPVAEMLCKIISHIGMENIENNIKEHETAYFIETLKSWWKDHRKRDILRIQDELKNKIKETSDEYIASLSKSERKLIDSHHVAAEIILSETFKRDIE